MAFMKVVRGVRNHWKKSTFAAIVFTYGAVRTKRYIETQGLMRVYCEKACEYGRQTIGPEMKPRSITVILNPNANKRKAADDFEAYCAPLLHLAGILVEVVKTNAEGHAKTIMESLKDADAVVVAGGDGTLSEVVTGLLRRTNENKNGGVPIGVLPLGRSNTVAKAMFPDQQKIRLLADATMAVIEEATRPVDVMKIETLDKSNEGEQHKPVYAVGGLKWGAYRDAEVNKDNYWYFGSLRKYITYLFSGAKSTLTWNCEASINYSPPCEGCSNCYKPPQQQKKTVYKWFPTFSRPEEDKQRMYLSVNNPECQKTLVKKISTSDLALLTSNAIPSSLKTTPEIPKLQLFVGPEKVDYIEFVRQGWKSENGQNRDIKEVIEAKSVEINPESKLQNSSWFSIDNENYEVKPVRVTLLPKIIDMYCTAEKNTRT